MKCRVKEIMDVYILSKENAKEVLNVLGFGEKACKLTHEKDGRYGDITEQGIVYGYKTYVFGTKTIVGEAKFGQYIIPLTIYGEPSIMNKEDFEFEYEIIEESR